MVSKKVLKKPRLALRLKSIGLRLASPIDIKNWSFQTDKKGYPVVGLVKNDKTINYKTLKPESGGLFCPKVFGKTYGKKNRRYKLGYIPLAVPLAHIWYLKGSPSYLSILLKKKRRYLQNIIYSNTCLSFSHQPFNPRRQCLTQKNFCQLYNTDFHQPVKKSKSKLRVILDQKKFGKAFEGKSKDFSLLLPFTKIFPNFSDPFYSSQSIYEMWFTAGIDNFYDQALVKQSLVPKRNFSNKSLSLDLLHCFWTKFWFQNSTNTDYIQEINSNVRKGFIYIWEDQAFFLGKLNADLKNQLKRSEKYLCDSKKFNKALIQESPRKQKLFNNNLNIPLAHFYNQLTKQKFQRNISFKPFNSLQNNFKNKSLNNNNFFQSKVPLNLYYNFKGNHYQMQRFFFTIYLQRQFLKMIFLNSKLWKIKSFCVKKRNSYDKLTQINGTKPFQRIVPINKYQTKFSKNQTLQNLDSPRFGLHSAETLDLQNFTDGTQWFHKRWFGRTSKENQINFVNLGLRVSKFNRILQRKNQRRRYKIYRRSLFKQQVKLSRLTFRLSRKFRAHWQISLSPAYELGIHPIIPYVSFSYCYPHTPLWSRFRWIPNLFKKQKTLFKQKHLFDVNQGSLKNRLLKHGLTIQNSSLKKQCLITSKTLTLQIKTLKSKFFLESNTSSLPETETILGLANPTNYFIQSESNNLLNQTMVKLDQSTQTNKLKNQIIPQRDQRKINSSFKISKVPKLLPNGSRLVAPVKFVKTYCSVLLFQLEINQTEQSNTSKSINLLDNFERIQNDKLLANHTFEFQRKQRYMITNQLKTCQPNWNPCTFWVTEEEESYDPLPMEWEESPLKLQLKNRIDKQVHRLKFFYNLPKRNVEKKNFNLNFCYLPLSCYYSVVLKPYVINSTLKFPPDMETRIKSKPKILTNPLGHKKFRNFIKKTFCFSIQKSVMLSQIKSISTDLCSEKSFDDGLLFKNQLKHRLIKFDRLKKLIEVEKDRVIKLILNQFNEIKFPNELNNSDFTKKGVAFIDSQENQNQGKGKFKDKSQIKTDCSRILKGSWWWQLTQQQKVILPSKTKFSGVCFMNHRVFKKIQKRFFDKTFSQKSRVYYSPWRSNWKYPYRVLKTYYKPTLVLKQQGVNPERAFTIAYDSAKIRQQCGNLELKRWKSEKELFNWLQDKKKVLNTLISINCHKVDLFTGFLKPTYSLHRSALEKLRRPWHYFSHQLPTRARRGFCSTFKLHVIENRYRYFGLKLWLKCLRLTFNASSVELTKTIMHYFSIKTKLIKAKTVRFLFKHRLFKLKSLAKPALVDFAWLLDLKKCSYGLMDYDKLLYRRCSLKCKKPVKPNVKLAGVNLVDFLETQRFNCNRFYLISQKYSWPLFSDFNWFVEFSNDQPRPNHYIVPAYVHQCITFETPRTGAWAIQTLLKRFKAKPTLLGSQTQFNLGLQLNKVFANQTSVMPLYYNFLIAQFRAIHTRVIHYQKAEEVLRLNLPKKLTKYFMKKTEPIKFGTHQSYFRKIYRRIQEKLKLKHTKLKRHLKLVQPFLTPENDPAWLILNTVPVLPPDLRPVLTLNDGQFAVSDLNRHYQQLIQRNNRLERFYGYDYIWEYENPYVTFRKVLRMHYRLAQQALDALIDNGKSDSKAVLNSRGQPLKSLAEVLRGKTGRFRQNLLGKRVDYSGRSVIIVGPQLKVHQCGLPKEMALELFQPFIIRYLIEQGFQQNFTRAKQWIRLQHPLLWVVVKQVLQDHPILLNRAPTLHRLGIQAFQPILVSGRAILLHPLVCSAFNADFDGDQMAVHVPLSYAACSEAWRLMWSCNSVFSPATGDPILTPTQDMVLGSYYLSTWDALKQRNFLKARLLPLTRFNKKHSEIIEAPQMLWFGTIDQVTQFLQLEKLQLHQSIWLRWCYNFELQRDQPCVEFQLNHCGYRSQLHPDYHKFWPAFGNQNQIFTKPNFYQARFDQRSFVAANHQKTNVWLRTTPGRALLNQIFFALAKKKQV